MSKKLIAKAAHRMRRKKKKMGMSKDLVAKAVHLIRRKKKRMEEAVQKLQKAVHLGAPVPPERVRLRDSEFSTGQCQFCRYFNSEDTSEGGDGMCAILATGVRVDQVCDAIQGDEERFKEVAFTVADDDMIAFGKGQHYLQPYMHIVMGAIDTPTGPLLLLRDTMIPKPHFFSLNMAFSIIHTGREHHWTQEEVDKIIQVGKEID